MRKPLLLLLSSVLIIVALNAIQTNVLTELFSSAGCSYCPSAQLGLEQLYDGHPNVIPILWYSGQSPVYSSRGSFYQVSGFPIAYFLGNETVGGGDNNSTYNRYFSKYNQVVDRISPLSMTNDLRLQSNNLVVKTNVTVTEDFNSANCKLVTVLTNHTDGNYRFLAIAYHDQPFSLSNAGQTQEFSASFSLNSSWDLHKIKAVSFVQTWTGDKKVHQAVQTPYSGLLSSFSSDITSGVRDLTVNFIDQSFPKEGIEEWHWDFDNDGVIDSYEQNPSHTFSELGTYTVSLTVINEEGAETSTITNMITVLDTDNVQGKVQGVWKPENGVYTITDHVFVTSGAKLEIMPGTIITFNLDKKMKVNGEIHANGIESNPIVFTSDFLWNGISLENTDKDNQFSHCIFNKSTESAIKVSNSKVDIISCILKNNSGRNAGAIDIVNSSTVGLYKCLISNNKSNINSGAINIDASSLVMSNCILANNKGQNTGAIVGQNNSFINLINNTLANNSFSANSGAQLINIGAVINIQNCIFFGINDMLNLSGTTTTSYSSLITPNDGVGNIISNPMFINPSVNADPNTESTFSDWMLQGNSPCIDSGNPASEYNDIEDPNSLGNALYPSLGTIRNDIGAFGGQGRFEGSVLNDENTIIKPKNMLISTYPNPFNPIINIELNRNNNKVDKITVDVYNVKGQKINNLYNKYTSDKIVSLKWNGLDSIGSTMPSGLYFIKITSQDETVLKKIILLK